jgi:trehalose-phosphatase
MASTDGGNVIPLPATTNKTMTRKNQTLPNALEHLNDIRQRLEGRTPALFLDYDGTLAPISQTPDAAIMPAPVGDILRRLAAQTTVAIISGRDRIDVERMVGVAGLIYAGAHGFDIGGGALGKRTHSIGGDFAPALAAVRRHLEASLSGIDGALIELKTKSIVVHYRMAGAPDVPVIKAAVNEAMSGAVGLRLMSGKKILEILPAIDWNKGRAVLWLIEALKLTANDTAVIYIGDDVTDEDAFKAVATCGIGIRVADADGYDDDTAATYRLGDTGEVAQFLAALAGMKP